MARWICTGQGALTCASFEARPLLQLTVACNPVVGSVSKLWRGQRFFLVSSPEMQPRPGNPKRRKGTDG